METLVLLVTFIVSLIARLHNSGAFATITAEVGQHYLETIKLLEGNLLLDGPLTSHSWLRLSSTPYYLFFPFFAGLKFHPLTLNFLVILVNILTVPLNYIVVKKTIDRNTAIISTAFLSVSPLFLLFGRTPGFYSFIIPLLYVLFLLVYNIVNNKNKMIWPIFLLIGFMTTLHAASFMLLPIFVSLFIFLRKFNQRQILASIAAFASSHIPFFLVDSTNGFRMTINFLLWIPYKLFNFLTGQTIGLNRTKVIDITLINISDFIKSGLLIPEIHWIFGLVVIIPVAVYFIVKKRSLFERVLCYWLFAGLLFLFIHKNPPIHYFVPVFVLPIILFSKVLSNLWKINDKKIFVILAVISIITINLGFIFSKKYLFYNPEVAYGFTAFKDQQKITMMIIKDVKKNKYSLSRIGPFDSYQGQSKEGYEFLLWWQGNPPSKQAKIIYVIVEGRSDRIKNMKKIGTSGKLTLFRINN